MTNSYLIRLLIRGDEQPDGKSCYHKYANPDSQPYFLHILCLNKVSVSFPILSIKPNFRPPWLPLSED